MPVEKSPTFSIGKIADFPVGETKSFPLHAMVVESLAEGLRARSLENDGCCYAVKTNQIGELLVSRDELWPENMIYSILKNEAVCLTKPLEENS